MKCDTCKMERLCDELERMGKVPKLDNCRCFTAVKPLTNADRIRAMTDEELAEWLNNNHRLCPPPLMHGSCPYDKGCGNCWLDWLKREVTE